LRDGLVARVTDLLDGSTMPDAHPRIAMSPSSQRLTFADRCLQTLVMDSMAFVERGVRARGWHPGP